MGIRLIKKSPSSSQHSGVLTYLMEQVANHPAAIWDEGNAFESSEAEKEFQDKVYQVGLLTFCTIVGFRCYSGLVHVFLHFVIL